MSKKYTLDGNAVLCDGQKIADYDPVTGKVTSPAPLHHKVRAAISNMIEPNPTYESEGEDPIVPNEPAPPLNPALGDKDPAFIAWFRRNHSPEEFAARYPVSRRLPKTEDEAVAITEPATRMEAE